MIMFIYAILAIISVISGILMITRRNVVHSALFLLLTMFCLAGIYLLLYQEFLAVLQILLYAGTVMVLFIFVVMAVNIKDPKETWLTPKRWILGVLVGILGLIELFVILVQTVFKGEKGVFSLSKISELGGNTQAIGHILYTKYLLPFELASIILLVAMIGAIVLTRREE